MPSINLAAATLLVAIQMMPMVQARDGNTMRPLENVFDPADPPALEASCADLEGGTDRRNNPWVRARPGGRNLGRPM